MLNEFVWQNSIGIKSSIFFFFKKKSNPHKFIKLHHSGYYFENRKVFLLKNFPIFL